MKAVLKYSYASLFVDDFNRCLRGKWLPNVISRLQSFVNSVNRWAQENGLKFFPSKTECTHFSYQRGAFTEPNIKLDETAIKMGGERFLGPVFDR